MIVVKDKKSKKDIIYYFDKDGHEKFHDDICTAAKNGKDLKDGFKAKQIREGAKVTVTCEKKDGKEICTEIKVEGGKKQ